MKHVSSVTAAGLLLLACLGLDRAARGGEERLASAPKLTLSEAIEIALQNNRPVRIAKLDVSKSKWQVRAIKTKRFPAISTDVLGSANLTPASFTFKQGVFGTVDGVPVPTADKHIELSGAFTGFAIAQVAQPLTQLYQVQLAVHEQELEVELSAEKYEAKRQSVAADVKQAYYATLQTESSLRSTEALVKQYEETDRVVLQYVAQESVLRSSSLEVKAELAQARYQVVQLNNTLVTQKEHLNVLLGRDLDTSFTTEEVPAVTSEETDLKVARRTALKQRPEVKEAEIDTQRAVYDQKLAKAAFIPEVAAVFKYVTPIDTQLLPQNIASAGVEVKWDPFDWGKRRDDIRGKGDTVQQSKYQLDETRSQVLLDVDNTSRKLAESRLLLGVADAGRSAATEKLREVNDQFKQAAVLLTDVLKQQAALANANHQYEESLLAFWSAKANFEKALGEE